MKGHFFPGLDGSVEVGRPMDSDLTLNGAEKGAHAYGYNSNSIGICLIGKKTFTRRQKIRLLELLESLRDQFKVRVEDILGHYECSTANGKTCPNMPMDVIRNFLALKP